MRTVYRNGRFAGSVDGSATTMVVDDATTVALGHIEATAGGRTVDLEGRLVTPAFVDAHVHLTATGLALTGLDLAGADSLAAALGRVEQAARASRGRPVLGGGWDDTAWPERRPPTAAELDRAGYGGMVYLARVDAHSAVVSSALLAAVPGLDGLDGYRPDGVLSRAAHDAVRTAAFGVLRAEQTEGLQRAALRRAAELGIACVHEMAGPAISSADDLRSAQRLGRDPLLPEVIGYWGELFGINTALELGAAGAAGDLFCDGAIGSHTAALSEPYHDRADTSGMLRFDVADLAEHIVRCDRAGLQAGFHAIGDAAVGQVLTAFEGARDRVALQRTHRIEHAEFVVDPRRLAQSGLIASMQPVFDTAWGGAHGMYATRLGAARARRLNRFADLAAAGVPLAFGSDAPVTALGPWAAVQGAVAPHDPDAAIDLASAFAAHTTGGWRAAARRGGTLAVGEAATFAVWAAELDPATGWPDFAQGEPTCLATVRDGVAIHDTGALGALGAATTRP